MSYWVVLWADSELKSTHKIKEVSGNSPASRSMINTPCMAAHIIRSGLATYGLPELFLTFQTWNKNLASVCGKPGNGTGRTGTFSSCSRCSHFNQEKRQEANSQVQSPPKQHPSPSCRNVTKNSAPSPWQLVLHHCHSNQPNIASFLPHARWPTCQRGVATTTARHSGLSCRWSHPNSSLRLHLTSIHISQPRTTGWAPCYHRLSKTKSMSSPEH